MLHSKYVIAVNTMCYYLLYKENSSLRVGASEVRCSRCGWLTWVFLCFRTASTVRVGLMSVSREVGVVFSEFRESVDVCWGEVMTMM